jgi:hypothetical protein
VEVERDQNDSGCGCGCGCECECSGDRAILCCVMKSIESGRIRSSQIRSLLRKDVSGVKEKKNTHTQK